jgi:hypothetical protein
MAKVVKLKLKDIKNIVENINQGEMEEQVGDNLVDDIVINKDENGKYYVLDVKNDRIIATL